MLKQENAISLNIFRSNNADNEYISNIVRNDISQQNIEYLYNIVFKLEKIILQLNINNNCNISLINAGLKNLVLDIYKTINENNRMVKRIRSMSISESSTESNNSNKIDEELNNNKNYLYKIEKYKNGNEYRGEFKNGVKDGKGTMYYKNGYVYEGDWKNGKRDGIGKYYKKMKNL